MTSNSSVELVSNRYGKSRVRLMKVTRHPTHHDVHEWAVQIILAGDFAAVHREGDNANVLPTDTMKNIVYSVARESAARAMEEFAMELACFLLQRYLQVASAEITIESSEWKRLTLDGMPHPTCFQQGGREIETTLVELDRESCPGANGRPRFRITSGFDHLQILKTANSSFEGYLKDSYTTLAESCDRLLGTEVQANWSYVEPDRSTDFCSLRASVRETMLSAFAQHRSRSVQHTLYAMGEAALEAIPSISDVFLRMPNKHCLLVDLSTFGQDNPNVIFVPTEDPHGLIEAHLQRKHPVEEVVL